MAVGDYERNGMSHWLDRAFLVGPYYRLCLSEREFHKELDRMEFKGAKPSFLATDHADASTHFLTYEDKLTAIVTLRVGKHTGIQVAAMLCHEAVHIWQDFRRHIGERSPGDETEAYAIQTIAQRLMESYQKQTRKR